MKTLVKFQKYIPLIFILSGLGLILFFDLHRYLNFETLQKHQSFLKEYIQIYPLYSFCFFVLIYTIATAFSVPGAAILTITGGFLFGTFIASLAIVIGATTGATCIFLATKWAFLDFFKKKAGRSLNKFSKGFSEDAFNYLLTLRLIPIFPFWLINIAPAFFKIKLSTYITATALGITPGVIVYSSLGNGLGALLAAGETPDLGIIFQPKIFLPLLGLTILSTLPILCEPPRGKPRGILSSVTRVQAALAPYLLPLAFQYIF